MNDILIPAAQIFLSVALFMVAVLCMRLDAKLNALRKGKDGVAAAANKLNAAVTRANEAIKALSAHTDASTELLQKRIEEAQVIADGLKFVASTVRALEPVARDMARDVAPDRAPIREASRERTWEDDDFVPVRRDPAATSRWDGLR